MIITDGRECLINGGPACGNIREPNTTLVSGDRTALDLEAIKRIRSYSGNSLADNYGIIPRYVVLQVMESEQSQRMNIT